MRDYKKLPNLKSQLLTNKRLQKLPNLKSQLLTNKRLQKTS